MRVAAWKFKPPEPEVSNERPDFRKGTRLGSQGGIPLRRLNAAAGRPARQKEKTDFMKERTHLPEATPEIPFRPL
jgi:hypothetical protein